MCSKSSIFLVNKKLNARRLTQSPITGLRISWWESLTFDTNKCFGFPGDEKRFVALFRIYN